MLLRLRNKNLMRLIFNKTNNKVLMKKKTLKKMKNKLNGSLMKSSFLDKKNLNKIQRA